MGNVQVVVAAEIANAGILAILTAKMHAAIGIERTVHSLRASETPELRKSQVNNHRRCSTLVSSCQAFRYGVKSRSFSMWPSWPTAIKALSEPLKPRPSQHLFFAVTPRYESTLFVRP